MMNIARVMHTKQAATMEPSNGAPKQGEGRPAASHLSASPASSSSVPSSSAAMRTLKLLRAAPPRPSAPPTQTPAPAPRLRTPRSGEQRTSSPTNFYDLPAELRIEIYRLALASVTIHILPAACSSMGAAALQSHALARCSRQVRAEVLPIIHSTCAIQAEVTDFNFDGVLTWLTRISPDAQRHLLRNTRLHVRLCYTFSVRSEGSSEGGSSPRGAGGGGGGGGIVRGDSLRRWLLARGDVHRAQPDWQYSGPAPCANVAKDLRRRVRRMKETREKEVLAKMVGALGVSF